MARIQPCIGALASLFAAHQSLQQVAGGPIRKMDGKIPTTSVKYCPPEQSDRPTA